MADYNIPFAGGSGLNDSPSSTDEQGQYYDVGVLRKMYYDYLGVKMPEIEEQKEARRYYHGAQWTDAELKILKARRQPPVTSNRVARKIDAITGLVERLRQDPKAFPRTPNGQQGADVATAVLRYALDHVDWKSKSPRVARFAAIEGIGGIEFDLAQGDHGDPDLDIHLVYTDTFFYDPRSYDDGFTDARFMGVSKWVDVEAVKEIIPEKADILDDYIESGTDLTPNSDREITWVNTQTKKIRLIDHWYIRKGGWCWALYVGNCILCEGQSPYIDERNKTFPKFLMFSSAVDHDGDRYGPIRNLKSAQDEVNHRRSKSLHILNSRRIIADKGAVDDVETARKEWAKPDGFIEKNPGKDIQPENQQSDFTGQLQLLQEAKTEIENFGPNPALIGQGLESSSGRAISLLQQAGIAELGPYIIAYRTWKIRVYRAIWNIIQRHWTAERWIRVTDDEGLAQFIQLNGVGIDPKTGQPAIINAVGSLDVDIILDEGPDNVNMAGDAFDTLQSLARSGALIPPEIMLELAPLQNSVKQRLLQKMEQLKAPDPSRQTAQQIALASEAAKIEETKSNTAKNYATAMKALHDGAMDAQESMQQAQELLSFEQQTQAPQPGTPPPGFSSLGPGGGPPGAPQQGVLPLGGPPVASPPPAGGVPPIAPQPLAPPGPPPPALAPQQPIIHIDPNREIIGPMMQGMAQHSDTVAQAMQSVGQAAQSMSEATRAMMGIAESVHALSQSMHDVARVSAAPTELLRDKKGRAVGSRKVVA